MSESKAAWKIWTTNPCFKHFLEMVDEIKVESIADEDRVPTPELTIQVIAESRGVRKGLSTLLRRIEDVQEGG